MWATWIALISALAVPAVVLLIAVWVFVSGYRGRRVGSDPTCAKCDYSLVGLPESSKHCPECGHDLTTRNAIALGTRKRHRWVMLLSGLALASFAVLIGIGVRYVWTQVNLAPYKPVAWLVEDLADTNQRLRQAAFVEFHRRTSLPGTSTITQSASPSRLLAAADRVLKWQADKSTPWFLEQGAFIERLRLVEILDDERYRQYLTNGIDHTLKVRFDYRIGDPFPVQVQPITRLGSSGGPVVMLNMELRVRTPDGELVDVSSLPAGFAVPIASSFLRPTLIANPKREVFSHLPAGPLTLEVKITTEIRDTGRTNSDPVQYDKPFLTLAKSSLVQVQLVPAGSDNIERIRRDGIAEELKVAMGTPSVRFLPIHGGMMIELNQNLIGLPADLAMARFVRHNDIELRVGSLEALALAKWSSGIYETIEKDPWNGNWPEKVTVILRPDPDVARNSVDIRKYADVELRWDDVPVDGISVPTTLTTRQYSVPP